MLRFTVLVLTLGLLKNEVQCGTIGRNPKTKESSLARSESGLPSHWTSNLESLSGNKVSIDTTNRIERSANASTKRQAKFLPKISFLAGLDIGGGLAAGATSNLSNLAKISQAYVSPGILNPYIAASYDPYPSSAVHQSIQALYNLVERLREQMDNFNKQTNTNSTNSLSSSEIINENMVDNRNRRKEKLKTKKSAPKRKKQEQLQNEEDEEEEEVEEVEEEDIDDIDEKKSQNVKKGSKNRVKIITHAKQVQQPTDNTTSMDANSTVTNSPDQANNTNQRPGWYYGGNPQPIGNVSFTYGSPQESYGAPSFNYGPPSTSYGTPSFSYGVPSLSYGSPSYSYVQPARGYAAPYEQAHFSAIQDSEPLIYDDPSENSFGPLPLWRQRLPFARSQNLDSKTSVPEIANRNGFVPML